MNILNKPINSFSFDDIASFCKDGHAEGIQLDYKKDLSEKGLSKHFASFSNTRGGVIIVGVEENKNKGTPLKWEGIANEDKLEDRVHQYATNVEPLPLYDVHTTDDKNGKVFLLIRIYEGDRTPYFVQNDSNIWIRTGNISNPIDLASPEAVELLFKKKEKAELAKKVNVDRATEIYKAARKRAETRRLELIAEEKKHYQGQNETNDLLQNKIYEKELGSESSMCTVLVQPFFPSRALITPQEIKSSIESIRVVNNLGDEFPSINVETIPDGVLRFFWNQQSGYIECEQLYANGLVYNSVDVLKVDNEDKIKKMWLSQMAQILLLVLKATKNFYKKIGYQGGIVGQIILEDVAGVKVYRIVPHGWTPSPFFEEDTKECLLNKYQWDFTLDVSRLNDEKELQSFFLEKIKELYWSLGYEAVKDDLLNAFLKQEGWIIE